MGWCEYFLLCDNEAVVEVPMGPLGLVKCCQSCADRYARMTS